MADKISDLSGEEREKRIAELKRKMQESAKRNREAQSDSPRAESGAAARSPEAVTTQVDEEVEEVPAPETDEGAAAEASKTERPTVAEKKPVAPATPTVTRTPSRPSPNGSTPKPAPETEGPSKADMNRREFLTYMWAGALGLLALGGGVHAFRYMYPRFRAGEFGGEFTVGPVSALPSPSSTPVANTDGKFWLVTTAENEPRALYMVCTHLGCLYQWVESNDRFECPCHGSKFTHDGHYIEGPAPRSLDHFETAVVDGVVVVDTGSRILGAPASESPAAAEAA